MAKLRDSQEPREEDRLEVMHQWAETAIRNFQNVVGCLMRREKDDDQVDLLGEFLANVLSSFIALRSQEDPFDFAPFSYAIDSPVCVFDYDDSSASYHAAAEDLVVSFIDAVFSQTNRSQITLRDADAFNAADVEKIAAAVSDTTGHTLEEVKDRLSLLAAGLAKEYTKLRTKPPIVKCQLPEEPAIPQWNKERRELFFRGKPVKEYRQDAKNQIAILEAFEQEHWPPSIDNPLPHRKHDALGQALRDAVHALSTNEDILFELDGTGRILWKKKPL